MRHASIIQKARGIFSKLLCGLVALLVLNSSIDSPAGSDVMKWDDGAYVEDLAYNDMESFFELFTEGLLDLEDFVPEHDNDADDTEKHSKVPQFFAALQPFLPQPPAITSVAPQYPECSESLLKQTIGQHTPPPDIAA